MLTEERDLLREEKRFRNLAPAQVARLERLELQLASLDVAPLEKPKPNLRDQGLAALDAQIAELKAKIAASGSRHRKA